MKPFSSTGVTTSGLVLTVTVTIDMATRLVMLASCACKDSSSASRWASWLSSSTIWLRFWVWVIRARTRSMLVFFVAIRDSVSMYAAVTSSLAVARCTTVPSLESWSSAASSRSEGMARTSCP